MHTNTTFFNYSTKSEIQPKQSDDALTGKNLWAAITLSLLVMGIAVLMGLQLASVTGIFWLGFVPLSLGWAMLYPAFKKLEN